MKRFTRFLTYASILALVFSCSSKDEGFIVPEQETGNTVVSILADVESTPTKTSLNEDLSVVWNSTDAISLLASGTNYQFTTNASLLTEEGHRATFVHDGDIEEQGYYALYPYNSAASFSGSAITTELPAIQTAAAGSFGPGANLAVAYADWGKSFKFKNAAAMIKISFKTTDANAAIKSITFRSLDESILLSGSVSLTPTVADGAVTNVAMTVTSGQPYVTLQAPSGETLQPNTEYYIAAAPAALTSGYSIEFETEDGVKCTRDYAESAHKSAVLQRNTISSTGKKNLDNYEISGYFRVRYAECNNHPGTGEYLVVYKMPDGSYRILDENGSDTYVVKPTHFELSGSKMVKSVWQAALGNVEFTDYAREQMTGVVSYVFRNAWISSSTPEGKVSYADDELITSSEAIGIQVKSYKYGSSAYSQKTYYYANIVLYNRTDNVTANITLDNLTCSLGSSDAGLINGNFNKKSASENSGGNPNTCSDLVDALMKNAGDFSGFRTQVINAAVKQIKGTDNPFTGGFTTVASTSANGVVSQNHFMIKTADLLSNTTLSDIWLYKYDTKTYAYYINNK